MSELSLFIGFEGFPKQISKKDLGAHLHWVDESSPELNLITKLTVLNNLTYTFPDTVGFMKYAQV